MTTAAQMNGSRTQHDGNVSFQVKLQSEPCLDTTYCVSLDKGPEFPEPQFPYLQNENKSLKDSTD